MDGSPNLLLLICTIHEYSFEFVCCASCFVVVLNVACIPRFQQPCIEPQVLLRLMIRLNPLSIAIAI